jgi:hypothetical protein
MALVAGINVENTARSPSASVINRPLCLAHGSVSKKIVTLQRRKNPM